MENNNNIKPTNWGLIARILFDLEQKSITSEEIEAEELSVPDKIEFTRSRRVSKKIDLYFSQQRYSETGAWNRVQQRIVKGRGRNLNLNMFLRIAAVVVVAAVLSIFVYRYYRPGATVLQKQLVASSEPLTSYELPDGTVVSLNSETKLFFPEEFDGNTREVSIEGEAYFDVKPDPTKPFIISAGKAQIKVLGTSFNVNAYPGTDKVEVIVETGKVRVTRKTDNTSETNELILDPGDKGTLLYATGILLKSKNEDENFLAWKTRNLIFRGTSLREVVATLEKVYRTNIDIADETLDELMLTGQYNGYTVEFILEVIASTLQLEVVDQVDGSFILRRQS
jgi:ferric-dicitrate binding protein FerR (iron transport regulator)